MLATEGGQAYYQAARKRLGQRSAYHTAVFDFFGAPEVTAVRWEGTGDLRIQVRDNVGVRRVTVAIDDQTHAAEPLPQGPEPADVRHCQLAGDGPWTVRVRAEDGMGNIGEWAGVVGAQNGV